MVGIVVHAPDTRILFANAMACELLGLAEARILGKTALDPTWCFVDLDGAPMPLTDYPVNRVIATGAPMVNQVLGTRTPARSTLRWLLVSGFPEYSADDGRLMQVIVNSHDIIELRAAEVQVWHQANFDGLADLPNRDRVRVQLAEALHQAAATSDRLAVMFVDLDRFKEVNDTLGHELGDALLKEVARRMAGCVPPGASIGRLGGVEFIIVLAGLSDTDDPAAVAGQVLVRLAEPYNIGGDLTPCVRR